MNEQRDDLSTADLAGQRPESERAREGDLGSADAGPYGRDGDADGRDDAGAFGRGDAGVPGRDDAGAFGRGDAGVPGRDDSAFRRDDAGLSRDDAGGYRRDESADADTGPAYDDRLRPGTGDDYPAGDADHGYDRPADAGTARDGGTVAGSPVDAAPAPVGGSTAGAGSDPAAPGGAGTVGAAADPGTGATTSTPTTGPLVAGGQAEAFRARWTDIQTGFVDAPRQAVHQADGLTAELMQHLAKTFADERAQLESQWDRGDDVATDDLRAAFQRYRSFFERLLAT